MPSMITKSHFLDVEMRVGKIVSVEDNSDAKKQAYKLKVDFGPMGLKKSSAQITNYTKEELVGKKVVGVINLSPMQVGQFISEVLVLGLVQKDGTTVLPDL